jgi:hypothetical protein
MVAIVLAHPSDKNKDVARVGQVPRLLRWDQRCYRSRQFVGCPRSRFWDLG